MSITAHRQRLIETSLSLCKEWTSHQMSIGNNPTLDGFLEVYPLFNVPYLVELIGVEMFNVKHDLPPTSEELQTIK